MKAFLGNTGKVKVDLFFFFGLIFSFEKWQIFLERQK